MNQKMTFILLWGVVMVGWLVNGRTLGGAQVKRERAGTSGEQPTPKAVQPITPEAAKAIAATFVGEERAQEMRYGGRFLRKTFPPFVMCHRFEIPLPVKLPPQECQIPAPKAPKGYRVEKSPEKPLKAEVWVEESGRVVSYGHDFGYKEAKYKGKERPKESDLISEARAREIAQEVVALARVPMEDMRLTMARLVEWHRNHPWYEYAFLWKKYVQVPELGEVQFPSSIHLGIDALTGELNDYSFREFPVVIPLVPPQVSKERAIALARKVCPLQEIQATEAHLKIDFDPDVPDWENEREVELWREDQPRLYREIGMKRQALVWQVRFKGKYTPPPHLVAPGHVPQPQDAEWTGIVNATTGKARRW